MRKFIWALMIAAIPVVGMAIPANATPHHPNRYNLAYDYKIDDAVNGWVEVKWTANDHGNGAIETRVFCADPINPASDYTAYSGIVRKAGIWDQAKCNDFTTPAPGFAQERMAVPNGAPWGAWITYG